VWHVHPGLRDEPDAVDAIRSALDRIAAEPGVQIDGPHLTDPPAPTGGTVTAAVTCTPHADVRRIREIARGVQSPAVHVAFTGDAFAEPVRTWVVVAAGAATAGALIAVLARTVRPRAAV